MPIRLTITSEWRETDLVRPNFDIQSFADYFSGALQPIGGRRLVDIISNCWLFGVGSGTGRSIGRGMGCLRTSLSVLSRKDISAVISM